MEDRVIVCVIPKGGSTFDSFDKGVFESIIAQLQGALNEETRNDVKRVVIFSYNEEKRYEVVDELPPHIFTPTKVAAIDHRECLRPVIFDEWVLREEYLDQDSRLEMNVVQYAQLQGATGVIVWYSEKNRLTTEELFEHVKHHRNAASTQVTTIGKPFPKG